MKFLDQNHDQKTDGLEAPPRLVSALKQSARAPIFIPATIDEAILRSASVHLTGQGKHRFRWSLGLRWGFAVAVLLLILALAPQLIRKPGKTSTGGLLASDLNHDGQVDILDAFVLAKKLKSGFSAAAQEDINGDGVVDERDVTELAARAVSLGKGGRS
jgi:hypothetical protein